MSPNVYLYKLWNYVMLEHRSSMDMFYFEKSSLEVSSRRLESKFYSSWLEIGWIPPFMIHDIIVFSYPDILILNHGHSSDIKPNADLDEVLNSMMERLIDSTWRCLNCTKVMANSTLMRRHCEIHLDCSHTCNICGKKAKTRNALEIHKRRYHGNGVGINNMQYWKFWQRDDHRDQLHMLVIYA